MTATSTIAPARDPPALLGQTVVVIGGSAGIGLELAPIRVNLIAQRAEILERGVLHFRRKLPAETLPAAAWLGRHLGRRLPPLRCRA